MSHLFKINVYYVNCVFTTVPTIQHRPTVFSFAVSSEMPVQHLAPMRNRAEKDAVRWCHLTHQVIAGASVHSREPKARVAQVYPYFVSKRFINHSIIIKSCQTCPAHFVMCYNAKTGVTETLLTIIFEPKTARFTSARHVLS